MCERIVIDGRWANPPCALVVRIHEDAKRAIYVEGTVSAARNRTNAAWLRAQLDDLAEHVTMSSTELSREEVRAALHAIRAGEPWRVRQPRSLLSGEALP